MRSAVIMPAMLGLASAFAPVVNTPGAQLRAGVVAMAQNKKVIGYQDFDKGGLGEAPGLFEAREFDRGKPPVYLLSRIEELKLATAVSEAGLLSTAEENGVFSSLEKAGAFSTAEKLLPLVEQLGLLTLFEDSLEVEAGLIFTLANWLIVFGPILLTLQVCGFVPGATGPVVPLEALLCLGTTAAGAAAWALAFAVGQLQED